ncbi:3-phosphoshikimate 1-carboxyvinyltransferase [Povalibacter sp.]|uniref:3-phosphoshikimate 1-carboxyvinyltransferase n=1 Tax=Povalibacter sp. TaxID=1962978 RepID=UPI002F3F149D
MSHYIVQPVQGAAGAVRVPGDKSISHRTLMLGGIAEGTTEVRGFLESEDCLATMKAMHALGVTIERPGPYEVRVHGVGLHGLKAAAHPLDMGNSGTAMRLMTGLLSGQNFDSELIGDSSLMQRPMERAAAPLRLMGARIATLNGKPPVKIGGGAPLSGIHYDLPVASAQVKSAILLAGLYAKGPTTVVEPAVTRDHTERMLIAFGCSVDAQEGRVRLEPPQRLKACSLEVPGDFSSSAFFLVAGSIGKGPGLTIKGVGINPTRTGLLDILALMGADLRLVNHRSAGAEPVADIEIRPATLKGIHVPEHLVPLAIDEFPALFVAAACAEGETLVTGAEELRVKESDRIAVMAEGLRALGVQCEVLPDGMRIHGRPTGHAFSGGRIESHGDHRIAMSFSVASLRAAGSIEIGDVANVATSFPGFLQTARSVGLDLVQHS